MLYSYCQGSCLVYYILVYYYDIFRNESSHIFYIQPVIALFLIWPKNLYYCNACNCFIYFLVSLFFCLLLLLLLMLLLTFVSFVCLFKQFLSFQVWPKILAILFRSFSQQAYLRLTCKFYHSDNVIFYIIATN